MLPCRDNYINTYSNETLQKVQFLRQKLPPPHC